MIPSIAREIIDKIEFAKFERGHFNEFEDSSLNFEVRYTVSSSDYTLYLDIQQKVNIALKEKFEQEGIEFAYPTQTLFVHKMKET